MVGKLAKELKESRPEDASASLKNLEYFAYGAQLPAQDQVTRFILSQKGSIEEHLSHREFLEAIAETAKLEGYIARYKEEADTIHISLDGVGQKLIYDTTQRVVQIGNRKIQLTNMKLN